MKNTSAHKYTWPAPSPIVRVECEPAIDGPFKARLVACEGPNGGDLSALPKQLHKYGFHHAYADVHDGQNVLVVPHVKDPEKLVAALASAGYLKGDVRHEMHEAKKQKAHLDTLKWSGRVGLIGHAALMVNGALQGDWNKVMAGPLGASTAAILAGYGNGKTEIDFDTMLKHMNDYFAAEGIDLPPLDAPEQKNTILQRANNLLAKYPLPIGYTIGSLGALSLMQSGLRTYRATKGTGASSGLGLLLAGTSSLTGNMAVLFVPEKKKTKAEREREKKRSWGEWFGGLPATWGHLLTHPTQIPGAAYNFVAESPLRFNGGLNFLDNISYFIAAAGERKKIISWGRDNPGKITALKQELGNLFGHVGNAEAAQKIVDLNGKIGGLGKELKLSQSWQGKYIPYLMLTTAFSFGCATFLSAISSKNRGDDYANDESYDRLYALVSKLVVQMPKEQRADALGRVADYLSTQVDVKDGEITAKKLSEEVTKRVALMEQSPWLEKKISHAEILAAQPKTATAALA